MCSQLHSILRTVTLTCAPIFAILISTGLVAVTLSCNSESYPVTVIVEKVVDREVQVIQTVEVIREVEVPATVVVERVVREEVPIVQTVEVEKVVDREIPVIQTVEVVKEVVLVQTVETVHEVVVTLAPERIVVTVVIPDSIERSMEAEESMTMSMEDGTSRLQIVKDRGKLVCASRNDVPGYASLDDSGESIGFDIDLCRAVASAVLGDPEAIQINYITAAERGPTIQSGEVDLLVRTVTWTSSRDIQWGNFIHIMSYEGQGFMVPKNLGVTSAYELGGATVCVTSDTTTELNMADFFRQNNLEYSPNAFEAPDAVLDAYKSGQCDVFTNDRSQLAVLRSTLPNPDDHVILPETISEEPLGPVVPHGDEQWFDIVKTVMAGLIYAEAYGINSNNVDTVANGDNIKAKILLGIEGNFGQESLELSNTFMQEVIKQVGNYGEIYYRNLGPDGVNLPREGSRNALWSNAPCTECPKGGQIYAAPLR